MKAIKSIINTRCWSAILLTLLLGVSACTDDVGFVTPKAGLEQRESMGNEGTSYVGVPVPEVHFSSVIDHVMVHPVGTDPVIKSIRKWWDAFWEFQQDLIMRYPFVL